MNKNKILFTFSVYFFLPVSSSFCADKISGALYSKVKDSGSYYNKILDKNPGLVHEAIYGGQSSPGWSEPDPVTPPSDSNNNNRIRVYKNPQDLISIPGNTTQGGTVYLSDGNDKVNVTGAEDTVYAGGGDDEINTGTWSDVIDAGSGDDIVRAGWGADLIYGGSGSDVIDGGEKNNAQQTDTVIYAKPREAYDINYDDGTVYVEDIQTGDIDTITNVERFFFGYNSDEKFDVGNFSPDKFDKVYLIEYPAGDANEGQINKANLDDLLVNP